MNTIAIALSDERLLKLQKLANDLNVSIEELVLIGIENLLAQPESISPYTAQNILNKTAKIPPDIVDNFYALASDGEKDVAGLSSTAQMSQIKCWDMKFVMAISQTCGKLGKSDRLFCYLGKKIAMQGK